jgi:formate dehydrogenase subunit gamma
VVEYQPWSPEAAKPVIERRAAMPGGLLSLLIDLQEAFGYINAEDIPAIAEAFNISRAEVVGVINFYHDFKQAPPARHSLKVCLAEACQANGSDDLVASLRETLGVGPGERTADGAFDFDPVYCLGNCGLSPALMLDGTVYGRVNAARAHQLLGAIP